VRPPATAYHGRVGDERKQQGKRATARALPTPAESWRRETEILELVKRIRDSRRQRHQPEPTRTTG
jgi:hypothetical protein